MYIDQEVAATWAYALVLVVAAMYLPLLVRRIRPSRVLQLILSFSIAGVSVSAPQAARAHTAELIRPQDSSDPWFAPVPHDDIYVVVSGDNLWTIAQREHSGAQSTEAVWKKIIDDNVSHLRSGNPHLIYPGEEITISSDV